MCLVNKVHLQQEEKRNNFHGAITTCQTLPSTCIDYPLLHLNNPRQYSSCRGRLRILVSSKVMDLMLPKAETMKKEREYERIKRKNMSISQRERERDWGS